MQRMTAIFQRVGLIGKHGDPSVKERVLGLGEFLQQRGHQVLLEEQTAQLLFGFEYSHTMTVFGQKIGC